MQAEVMIVQDEHRGRVQRVALPETVPDRVEHLRMLSHQVVGHYLVLAEALHVEHEAALWQYARTDDTKPYGSEEHFWEDALGIRRRSAYQLLAIGRVLATLRLPEADQTALAAVGLHKLDTMVPVLEQVSTPEAVRMWTKIARTQSRETLREKVREALGHPKRPSTDPGRRFQRAVINIMPDLETRTLATEFFEAGARYVESENAIAILIAAMQEALATWRDHEPDSEPGG